MAECKHQVLQLAPSPFASLAGYTQPSLGERIAATGKDKAGKTSSKKKDLNSTFPAPLVLPFDDLNYDPDASAQDFTDWHKHRTRNKVTASKRAIYIARVPEITERVSYMQAWTVPSLGPDEDLSTRARSPQVEDHIAYLRAFYHGMQVQELLLALKWTSWSTSRKPQPQRSIPPYVALQHGNESTRIRTRRAPDGVFPAQLNLNDILDAAIRILPADAHALCLVVAHDMWEEDDDFCCGRAYGGSRVAVVQTARYNPALDGRAGIDTAHMWPLSHCKAFVDRICVTEDLEPRRATQRQVKESGAGALRCAVDAATAWARGTVAGQEGAAALWFSRLARTASHEIGHCFALAHCVYYACAMQSTAGLGEDARQPPYLCPVCEAKLSHAIAVERLGGGELEREAWVRGRCVAVQGFCEQMRERGEGSAMWSGLEAWSRERLLEL